MAQNQAASPSRGRQRDEGTHQGALAVGGGGGGNDCNLWPLGEDFNPPAQMTAHQERQAGSVTRAAGKVPSTGPKDMTLPITGVWFAP